MTLAIAAAASGTYGAAGETFTGTASVKGAGGAAATAPITVTVDRTTPQKEADTLVAAFKSGGAAALRKALAKFYPEVNTVRLHDYKVRVLSSTEGTAAVVRVLIESGDEHDRWGTVGVSHNVIEASWQALADTNLPLLTYKRARGEEGAKLIPALAEAMPEVTDGGKTYQEATIADAPLPPAGVCANAGVAPMITSDTTTTLRLSELVRITPPEAVRGRTLSPGLLAPRAVASVTSDRWLPSPCPSSAM